MRDLTDLPMGSLGRMRLFSYRMIHILTLRSCTWMVCLAALVLAVHQAIGQEPDSRVIYQGRLSHNGVPLEGQVDLRVTIHDSESVGSQLGPPTLARDYMVFRGQVRLPVDFTGVPLNGSTRWLEFSVRTNAADGDFMVLRPRQPISVVPQALYSVRAQHAALATNLVGGGMYLTSVPADRLVGRVPPSAISGITPNQLSPETDAIYRADKGQLGMVTPFDCGAVGDGITDDTAALQKWINRACNERLLAFLPPAPGGFYKITDTLYADNAITMIGAGGGNHTTSDSYTRSMIKQFTLGKHGLVLSSVNDSVHLARVAFMAHPPNNRGNTGVGIWFAGGGGNADCCVVEQCMVMYFGIGVLAGSQADTTFRQCSFGFNKTGIQIQGIANNISLDSCQLSYNYDEQVNVNYGAKVIIQNSDIAAGADGTKSARGVVCSERQDLIMLGSRFEDYTTNACLTVGLGSRVTLLGTRFANFSRALRYSLVVTSSTVITINSDLECIGPTGAPILDVGVGRSSVTAIPPVRQYISIGRDGYMATASTFTAGRASWTGSGPGQSGVGAQGWAAPGTLEWGWGLGPAFRDHALYAYAQMDEAGYPTLQAVDLLAYAKEQRLGLRGNGAYLTNLNGGAIVPGTINARHLDPATDVAYRNAGAITNQHSAPVRLQSDLSVGGALQLLTGSIVVNTNATPPQNTAVPKAWFEIKTPDGGVYKVGLYK